MTTKQIAAYIGKPDQTVKNWVKRASSKMDQLRSKMDQATNEKKPANYDLEETIAIIEVGMGANAAAMYRANAGNAPPAGFFESGSTPQSDRLDRLESIVEKLVTAFVAIAAPGKDVVTQKAITSTVPEIPTRVLIKNLVDKYAVEFGDRDFNGCWWRLYKEFGDRYQMNVRARADNRNIRPIDYLESEGLLSELYAVAILVFGKGAA